MPKKRKASSNVMLVPPPMRSRRVARKVTTAFHRLGVEAAAASAPAERAALEAELEAARVKYQEASALSTAAYSTSRWVLKVLRRRGVLTGARGAPEPACLEVGAINAQLLDARGLATRAIDLRSSVPGVEKVDFFDLAPARAYDVVVCALVLNCVPDAASRGRMVANIRAHLKPGGAAFLVVPRTCLERSSRSRPADFFSCLEASGFKIVERKYTPRLVHVGLQADDAPAPWAPGVADGDAPKARKKKTTDFAVSLPGAPAPRRKRKAG